ncbi:MAG: septum formation initiator family protein [Peptococcaceae bacterium]|nr:septum formation initiator family protein [Peptococcaceae bacterium]
MAVPLRKVSGGYVEYEPRRQRQAASRQSKNARPQVKEAAAAKRLVKRQVKSNADYRQAVVWVFLGMAAVLFLMGISYTFVKAGVSNLNYQLNTTAGENDKILMENERLRSRIANLESLDRIESIASQELGMVRSSDLEYMVLSSTVIAEGKIKPVETVEEEAESVRPLAAIIDFLLAWK